MFLLQSPAPKTDAVSTGPGLGTKKSEADDSASHQTGTTDTAQVTWLCLSVALLPDGSAKPPAKHVPAAALLGGLVAEWGGWRTLLILGVPKTSKPTQRYSGCVPDPICHVTGQHWHMGVSPEGDGYHICCTARLWPHSLPWVPLAARTARSSSPSWHLQAHQIFFALAGGRRHCGQQGHHSHCSRWHCRDSDLSKQGWPLQRWGSHCPLWSLCSNEGGWGQLCWGGLYPTGGVCGG